MTWSAAWSTALQANDEWAKTVFIFTSDNGYFYGQHRLTDKVLGYEESIRVPLYIRAPGFPSQVTTRAALNNDLASDRARSSQASRPGLPVDGRSLLRLMRNPLEGNWRKRFLVEYLGTVETNRVPPRVPFTAVRTTNLSKATPPEAVLRRMARTASAARSSTTCPAIPTRSAVSTPIPPGPASATCWRAG